MNVDYRRVYEVLCLISPFKQIDALSNVQIPFIAGDYYIMLQGTQGNTIQGRYDSLGNLTSPPIQAHRTTDSSIGQTQQQVVYAAARKYFH